MSNYNCDNDQEENEFEDTMYFENKGLDLGEEYGFLEKYFEPIMEKGYAFPLSQDRSLLFVCESPYSLSQKSGIEFTPLHYYAVISKGCDLILNVDYRHNQYFRDQSYSIKQIGANEENSVFSVLDKVLWVIRETHSNSPITLTKYLPVIDEELVPIFHLSHMYAAGTSNNPLGGFSEDDMCKLIIIIKVFLEYVNKMSETGIQIQPGITRVAIHCHQTLAPSALILFIIGLLLNYQKIQSIIDNQENMVNYTYELLLYIEKTLVFNLGKQRIPSDNAMIHFFPEWKTGITMKSFPEHIHSVNKNLFDIILRIASKNYERDLWIFH